MEVGLQGLVSKIVTFIQYYLKQRTREGKVGETMRQKTRIWASEECERRVLLGRPSQYLERRAAIPRERKDPASLRVRVEAEHKAWSRTEKCGGRERPPGAPGLRCWTSASSASCSVPVRDPVYLGTWAFCLDLETRQKGRQFHGPHKDAPG